MRDHVTERRLVAVIGVLAFTAIHFAQIQGQPEAVLSGTLLVVSTAFLSYEAYRSSDIRDIKATVATIRLKQASEDEPISPSQGPADGDEWVAEKAERVPLRGEDSARSDE